jgi:hypothetical protein
MADFVGRMRQFVTFLITNVTANIKPWFLVPKEPARRQQADDQMLSIAVRYSLLIKAEDWLFCLFYFPMDCFLSTRESLDCATICHISRTSFTARMLTTR